MNTERATLSPAVGSIREGSSLYYSLLWINSEARQRFSDRLNLINSLANTLDDVQEPQVAEKKIHWWHEELQRLKDGSARHPATQACQSELVKLDAAHAALLEILSAASTQRFTPSTSEGASNDALIKNYQARLALLAHALSGETQDLIMESHPDLAAAAFARYEQLARLPVLIHRGLPVFSSELYKRFDVQPIDLAKYIPAAPVSDTSSHVVDPESTHKSSSQSSSASLISIPVVTDNPGRSQLIAFAIKQALEAFTNAVESKQVKSRYRQSSLLPLWRLLVLRERQILLWHKKQPDLLRERTTLTPLHKLYYAWRHRK